MKRLYIPAIEERAKPGGVYEGVIEKTKSEHPEYPKIWDLFAFGEDHTSHLARFTNGLLRTPATISPGLRELVAAYTSRLNQCAFCTKAHAAAAGELLESHELVEQVLNDPESAPLAPPEKLLLRFVKKLTHASHEVSAADMEPLREAGWDDEAIYYTITTCALFNFYNRWISGSGVPAMSDEMHRWQGRLIAKGYVRD
ncbi:MAG: peroxidase-related enzyme [Bryobacterales bacterium]|nr:peroxidase-related enzyme [Bryobacterales bacterium]